MVLSKRERYIVIATAVAVCALALDRYILAPILSSESQLDTQKQNLLRNLDKATSLFKRKKAAEARWQEMKTGGLKADAAETENALLHAVREWSQDAGLALSSVRPERAAQKGHAPEVTAQVAGSGNMNAVVRFLWRLQTSPLPVKLVEVQLASRREGVDDLSLQVRLSALYLSGNSNAAAPNRPASASEGSKR